MADTFVERIRTAQRLVGDGVLVGTVLVDQVYAHYQDSGIGPPQYPHIPAAAFHHPRGGQAAYLSGTFREKAPSYIAMLASALDRGVPLAGEMVAVVTDLAREVHRRAPREFWILRNSASAEVTSSGARYFFLPALIPRLSQSELNAIRGSAGVVYQGQVQHESAYAGGRLTLATRYRLRRVLG